MFGSFFALSTLLSEALDKRIRVLERAKSFGERERERERQRKEKEEDQVEDSRQPGLTSGCSGSDWTGFA